MEKLKLKRKYVRPMKSQHGYEVVRIRKTDYVKVVEVAEEAGKSYIDTLGILISYAHKNIDYEEE